VKSFLFYSTFICILFDIIIIIICAITDFIAKFAPY
jgi:hypothetical protein